MEGANRGKSSQRSGAGTDSDQFTSPNDTSTPSEQTSNRSRVTTSRHERTISSSERELSQILRKEGPRVLEKNKNFLDPALMTRDSNSSRSPNRSGSQDCPHSHNSGHTPNYLYEETSEVDYHRVHGYYYQYPAVYPAVHYPQPQYTHYMQSTQPNCVRSYTQLNGAPVHLSNAPPAKQFKGKQGPEKKTEQATVQPAHTVLPRRDDPIKLDPTAPAYDQKKRTRVGKTEEPGGYTKEEKKERATGPATDPGKTKGAKKSVGNAAGNTIRQIINRKKLRLNVKPRGQAQNDRGQDNSRRAKSRDTLNSNVEAEDNDTQSDVYAPEEIGGRKREESKKGIFQKVRIRKSVAQISNVIALNPIKPFDPPQPASTSSSISI